MALALAKWRASKVVRRQVANFRHPGQRHGHHHLGAYELEHMGNTGLSFGSKRIGPGAAEQDAAGTQGQHAHNIKARAHSAVYQYRQPVAHGRRDWRQGLGRRQHAIQLSTAMVRHHYAV